MPLVAALALAVTGTALSLTLPSEPAPVSALGHSPPVEFTSPAVIEGQQVDVGTDEIAVSGFLNHPLATQVHVSLATFNGDTVDILAPLASACVRACGSLLSRSRFGPHTLNLTGRIPIGSSAELGLVVYAYRNTTLLSRTEHRFTIRHVPPPDGLNVFALGMHIDQGPSQPDLVRADRRRATTAPAHPRLPTEQGARIIKGKPTLVRVLGAASGTGTGALANVPVRLYGTRHGDALPGSPLSPAVPTWLPEVGPEEPTAPTLLNSLNSNFSAANFLLPASWRKGTVRLRAVINPPDIAGHYAECAGCEDRANEAAADIHYTTGAKLRIAPWKMKFTHEDATEETQSRSLQEFFQPVADLFPLRPSDLLIDGYKGTITTASDDCEQELSDFFWHTWTTSERGLRVGVLPDDRLICTTDNGLKADGVFSFGGSIAQYGDDGLAPPHELGHDLGLKHATCVHGEAEGGPCDPSYPVVHGAVDGPGYDLPTGRTKMPGDFRDPDNATTLTSASDENDNTLEVASTVGFFPGDQIVVDTGGARETVPIMSISGLTLTLTRPLDVAHDSGAPVRLHHVHDFMSYGSPNWMSRYSFDKLLTALRQRAGSDGISPASLRTAATTAPGLLVTGKVAPDGRAQITGVLSAEGERFADAQPSGPYSLRAFDKGGKRLAVERFRPHYATHSTGVGLFAFALPDPNRIARVVVDGPNTKANVRKRSASAPAAEVDDGALAKLGPSGFRTIRWKVSDGDGDPLRVLLQFSADAGRTWRTVGLSPGGAGSFRLDLSQLPSTRRGKLRMIATDGFNSRVVTSGRKLKVPNHRPDVAITQPVRGFAVLAGNALDFSGAAIDADGRPRDRSLRWSSDRDGDFGTGGEATLLRPSIGRHRIRLRAKDDRGAVGTANVMVEVLPATRRKGPAPRALNAKRTSDGIRVTFSEEVVGIDARRLRLEVDGKQVDAKVVPYADSAVLDARGRLPKGTLRVRLRSGITDLGGKPVKPGTLAVKG